jgi:FkbM family methyltransferase
MIKKSLFAVLQRLSLLLSGTGIAKNKFIFSIYKYFLRFLKPKIVTTEGSRMILDKEDSHLLSIYPNFEPGETAVIKKFLKPGMIAVDAGANIGYFTLLMSRLVGNAGQVHAFEPGRENVALLKKNVKLNSYQNVVINNAAVSSQSGNLTFYLSDTNPQDHRIIKDTNENRKSYSVRAVTLDQYFHGKKVDFMKMDIQGAELIAFEGAKKILAKYHPTLVIEYWPYGIIQAGRKPEELFGILEKYKYLIKSINQKDGSLTTVNKKKLLSSKLPSEIFNFLCIQ